MHVQEQIKFRIPRPLHRTGGKITTTSPELSSSPKELLNLIWKQLEGSSLQETKQTKKAQSVPGRVRQLERRGQGTDRKLKLERAQARNSHTEEEPQLAFSSAKEEKT